VDGYVAMANEHANVYLDLAYSRSPRGLVAELVERVGVAKVVWGSDAYFFNQAQQIGKVLGARIADADKMPEPAKIREVVEDDDAFENDPSSPPPLEKSAENVSPASEKPIPLVSELPDDVKEMLSGFHINIHVYAEDPAERLVFINMRNRKVGDRIGEGGHVLKEITPDGVIIDYGKGQALLQVGR